MNMLKAGRPSVKKEMALKSVGEQKQLVKTNINMEKSFHRRIKQYALDHEITITELIHLSLNEYIRK